MLYTIYFTTLSVYDIEINALWDLIIVFFIYSAAQAELQSAYIKRYTKGIKVRKLVSSNYIEAPPSTTMLKLYKLLLTKNTHMVVTKKDGKYALVSKVLANPLAPNSRELLSKRIAEFAQQIPTVTEDEPVSKALERMQYEEVPALAVVDGKRLVGLLLAEHLEAVIALHMPQIMREK
jgi:CBS domain-containing protein